MSSIVPYIHTKDIHNLNSANEIIPYLIELFKPESILDVGCGTGTWLKVAQNYGVKDVLGLDGHFIQDEQLEIDKSYFKAFDLQKVLNLGRKYSMIFCLEVAEHLAENFADNLISNLVTHSNIIVFSAAIPHQGGQNHINEQPFEYWIKKFGQHQYRHIDIVRDKFWNNSNIDWWYKQNILVFTNNQELLAILGSDKPINTYIHPDFFYEYVKEFEKLKKSLSSPLKLVYLIIKKYFF